MYKTEKVVFLYKHGRYLYFADTIAVTKLWTR